MAGRDRVGGAGRAVDLVRVLSGAAGAADPGAGGGSLTLLESRYLLRGHQAEPAELLLVEISATERNASELLVEALFRVVSSQDLLAPLVVVRICR